MRLDETMDKYLETLQKLHYNNDTITIWHYCCDVGMFGYLGYSFEKRLYLASTIIIVFQYTLRELWLTNKKKVDGDSDNTVKEAEYSLVHPC
jgi:hypothetical protein